MGCTMKQLIRLLNFIQVHVQVVSYNHWNRSCMRSINQKNTCQKHYFDHLSTDVRFEHRIIRTLSVVEQLDLEISGKQLQLLLPFQSIPGKNNLYNEILCYVVSFIH